MYFHKFFIHYDSLSDIKIEMKDITFCINVKKLAFRELFINIQMYDPLTYFLKSLSLDLRTCHRSNRQVRDDQAININ